MTRCHEREVRDCCLKSCGVFYFSNMWWDLFPHAICSGVEREHCTRWLCNDHGFFTVLIGPVMV